MRKLIPILSLFLLSIPADAGDINAASCSTVDVQAAIDAAVDGDRVLVPAGNCTWTGGIVSGSKDLTLQGAGKTSTVITLNGGQAFDFQTTTSRLTGFGFILASGDNIVRMRGQGWRIDNNKFDNQTGSKRVGVISSGGTGIPHPTGVVDHNEFINARVLVFGDLRLLAHEIWFEPSTIGNPDQTGVVYVEDNTFTRDIAGNSMDSNYGGRYVFRHNSVTKSSVEVHSVQSNNRAGRSWEIYENTFDAPSPFFTAMFIRGGTGVVFNNTITGSYTNPIDLDNVRSFTTLGFPPGTCDGSSSWDANQGVGEEAGWQCRDQIGMGADESFWDGGNPTPPQESEPAYFWNNTFDGQPTDPFIVNNSGKHIQAGRDYFLVARPGYTPFTYPHPLVSGAVPPAPPTNLRVVVR